MDYKINILKTKNAGIYFRRVFRTYAKPLNSCIIFKKLQEIASKWIQRTQRADLTQEQNNRQLLQNLRI